MNTYEAALRELKEKYLRYINNLQWHIKTNNPDDHERARLKVRIGDFREVHTDLDRALAVTAPPRAQEVDPVELLEYVGSRGFEYCEDGGWSNYSRDTSAWQSSDLVKEYKEFEAKMTAFKQSKTDNHAK